MTGAHDGTVRMWRLKLADLIDAACRVAGRELTAQEVTTFLGGAQAQHLCGHQSPRKAPRESGERLAARQKSTRSPTTPR